MSTEARRTPRPITAKARLIVSLTATTGLAVTLLLNTVDSLEPAYQNLYVKSNMSGDFSE